MIEGWALSASMRTASLVAFSLAMVATLPEQAGAGPDVVWLAGTSLGMQGQARSRKMRFAGADLRCFAGSGSGVLIRKLGAFPAMRRTDRCATARSLPSWP